MTAARDQFSHDLRLAREFSLGRAAFLAFPEGEVVIDQLPGEAAHLSSRVESLARDSLSHPGARTGDLFWNARVVPDADTPDDSVACVAIGLEYGGTWLGLLGVADSWLPELDAEQRASLIELAGSLARSLAAGARPPMSPADAEGMQTPATQTPATQAGGTQTAGTQTAGTQTSGTQTAGTQTAGMQAAGAQAEAGPEQSWPVPEQSWPTAPQPAQADAAESLISSEGFLGEVVDHLPEALVVAQDDGTIIYANRQFSTITGLAPDVLLGGDAVTLFSGDDPVSSDANWPEDIGSLFGAPPPGRRLSVASADDGYIPVDAFGRGFSSRLAGACHVGVIREARGELGMGASPGTASAMSTGATAGAGRAPTPMGNVPAVVELLDALEEGIMMCDATGTVLVANRAARSLQGLPAAEQLVGRPFPRATGLLTPDGDTLAAGEYPLEQALQGTVVTGEQFVLDVDEPPPRPPRPPPRPTSPWGSARTPAGSARTPATSARTPATSARSPATPATPARGPSAESAATSSPRPARSPWRTAAGAPCSCSGTPPRRCRARRG